MQFATTIAGLLSALVTLQSTTTVQASSFSACLLTMDDNHYLTEWLAYHYHVMPLRKLIITIDPRSETSPDEILKRWSNKIEIVRWTDADFIETQYDDLTELHLSRQREFIVHCVKTLRDEGERWALLTDVDEYTMVNPVIGGLFNNDASIEEPGSVLKFLEATPEAARSTCVRIYRRQFGGKESTFDEISEGYPHELRLPLSPENFSTLRWRHYGYDFADGHKGVLPGKTIIDLSLLKRDADDLLTGNPHNPIDDAAVCDSEDAWLDASGTLFMANHYLGTLEQYLFRNDARIVDRIALYEERKSVDAGRGSDDARYWLKGFVADVGIDEAERLLAGVGKLAAKPSVAVVNSGLKHLGSVDRGLEAGASP